MAKKNKAFIQIKVTGYIPAADLLDRDSISRQFDRIAEITNFVEDKFEEPIIKTKQVNRLVAEPKPAAPQDTSGDEE